MLALVPLRMPESGRSKSNIPSGLPPSSKEIITLGTFRWRRQYGKGLVSKVFLGTLLRLCLDCRNAPEYQANISHTIRQPTLHGRAEAISR